MMSRETYRRLLIEKEELENSIKGRLMEMGKAKSDGDWHDNFAGEEMERQVHLLAIQLRVIDEKLIDDNFIFPNKNCGEVLLGNRVNLLLDGEQIEVSIMGNDDAHTRPGEWISFETPLARAIINRHVGDFVKYEVENRSIEVKIIKIKPGDFDQDLRQ